MKLAIIGYGFVGKAIDYAFPTTSYLQKVIIDPKLGTDISDLKHDKPEAVFVSVPTSMGNDGNIDSSILESVMVELARIVPNAIVMVKSTITPDVLERIDSIHNRVIYNPEFLTERNANNDFVNAPMLVFGGKADDIQWCKSFYATHSICEPCPIFEVDLKIASLLKYTINSFLATKVTFFNQIKEIFTANGGKDWDSFTSMLAVDNRIGKSHMQVPGSDGRLGWGSSCFAKDTVALLKYAESQQLNLSVLKTAVIENQKTRKQYPLDKREIEQNVSYNIKLD